MDIFGGVLDIVGAAAEGYQAIQDGHEGSGTQITDHGSDGLDFFANVLQGVTKFVGDPEDRELMQKFIEDLETTGRQVINDAATIESRDETTGITIYALDGLRLYGNLHMGIAEQMLNEPVEKSNAAFLIKILKNGCDIVNDVWEQDIEKIKSAHATCEDMCASLTEWGRLLEDHKNQLQARKEELVMEKRKLVVLFEDFMKQDIKNDVVIDKQQIYIEKLEIRAKSLEDRIASNEYAYSKANQHLSQTKAKRAGFIGAGAGFPLFGLCVWLSGGYKKLDREVQGAVDRVNNIAWEMKNQEGKLEGMKIDMDDAEIILKAAIKEGERLQKEIDDNQAAQAKNKELRKFFTKMHEVAVEELKIENEIETRAFCLQTDLRTFSEYSRLTDRRFKKILKGSDDLMNYISDEKLLDLVTGENDKELVTIAQTRLQVMQGVSFVGRHAELGYEFED